jgi:pimeloyl-ACP methyl ester carboxylesterase
MAFGAMCSEDTFLKLRMRKENGMPYCTSGGISLYFEVYGQGTPLLLLSGLGGGVWSWFGQIPFFQAQYQTIAFDNRGAGRSDIPPPPYAIREFARDALRLLDHLQVEQAFVMGLSMGGMIAQELALMAPHRMRALVLGCTHCGGSLHISPSSRVLQTLMNNGGITQEGIIRKNLPLFFSETFLRDQPESAETYVQNLLQAPHQPAEAFEGQLKAIRDFDCCARLYSISTPTLIVTGSMDILVPPENSRILAERISHAEHVVIPGAGHALHVECRDTLNALALDFFNRHSAENAPTEKRRP